MREHYGVFWSVLEALQWAYMLVALVYQDSYPGRVDAGEN
jgi:hypothetical protein